MRLITYETEHGPRLGMARGEFFVPIPDVDMIGLIEAGESRLERVRASTGFMLPLASVNLRAPLTPPRRNVFCVGMNYAEHAVEFMRAKGHPIKIPEVPVFFTKATTAVTGPYADVAFDSAVTQQLDWEVELGVVIWKKGMNIPRDRAMEHVFGYTIINDLSALDLQNAHNQFFKGKSLDGACPMGPWIVTREEIPNPHNLVLRCRVNGVTKQESYTGDLIFNIPLISEWLSKGMTLLPGDVISTGTPSGIGFARTPPEFLKPGDVVDCEVEGIGIIRNRIVAALPE